MNGIMYIDSINTKKIGRLLTPDATLPDKGVVVVHKSHTIYMPKLRVALWL